MIQRQRQVYLETFGCQMNLADSEIVLGILNGAGYRPTKQIELADVVLVNTCAVRENAEQRVYGRLGDFRRYKKENPAVVVGVLGCMAERLRKDLLESESSVDLVVGPDEYRRLPELIGHAIAGERGMAVRLLKAEQYDDIPPYREEGVSAWIPVMRGCDKFCTFCVVPFTRGRERSRPQSSILREVEQLSGRGFREVTLLGQNVNSYRDPETGSDFASLLTAVAAIDRRVRVRFTTSHPQDMSDRLIEAIARHANLCRAIHLPLQSGSDRILRLMNRTYTVDQYLQLVARIRGAMPDVTLSTDIIAGFPTEREEDHRSTLDVMQRVDYDGAFTFQYSPRENTKAWLLPDDVPQSVKIERLTEIIDLQRTLSLRRNRALIGEVVSILVEGESKKSASEFCGRTEGDKMVIFPRGHVRAGEYAEVRIERVNSATLFGRLVPHSVHDGRRRAAQTGVAADAGRREEVEP